MAPIDPAVWNTSPEGIDEIVKVIDEGLFDAEPGYRDFLLNVAKGLRGDTTEKPATVHT